jgi:lactoylglutathione lyase
MNIHHIALWTNNLEEMKEFYTRYFRCKSNSKYTNSRTGFESYFLEFDTGIKIELMKMESIPENKNDIKRQNLGLIHFAISTGTREQVIALTRKIKDNGYTILSEPRETGDGYFESCILDPEGNRVEIVA